MTTRLAGGAPSSPPIPPCQLRNWLGSQGPRPGRPDWNARMAQAGDAPGSPLRARNPVPADPAAYPAPSGAHPARSTETEAAAPVGEPSSQR